MSPTAGDLARIERLEAIEEIRQLAARYATALDRRDIDAMAALFVPDVRTHDGQVGRAALARWLTDVLSPFTTTFHLVANHTIDFDDAEHASGVVYCRPEHEVGDLWVVMPMQYWDRYEKRDGHWYFRSRSPHAFYAADLRESPSELPGRFHFPGNPMITKADLPERWESWQRFWQAGEPDPRGGHGGQGEQREAL